jgi:hypothetical protein
MGREGSMTSRSVKGGKFWYKVTRGGTKAYRIERWKRCAEGCGTLTLWDSHYVETTKRDRAREIAKMLNVASEREEP